MRPSWWAFILLGFLTCAVTYQLTDQSSLPNQLPGVSDEFKPQPLDQKSDRPLIDKDEAQLQQGDSSPADLKPDRLPVAENHASREGAAGTGAIELSNSNHIKDAARLQEGDTSPADLKPDRLPVAQDRASLEDAAGTGAIELSNSNHIKDAARLQEGDSSPADLKPDQLPVAQDQRTLEDAAGTGAIEFSSSNDIKQNLSYLAYYAYSELPPETKPADTVLNSLKGIPPGTPVEEIKRVADILGLDFTFMKTVAKIESDFNPKQRTGSYIGLFQLSNHEFGKYGSGDILVSRDNTVAAALKFMTEAILFEMFTHRKPTLNDLYLIHQQGVDGAAEHISHPNRLAWRSMCATDEGKEKGEKWCKRAIWGNTLPAIKRVWKNVNNVTSGAFVGMWQQRVSHFYSKYSDAAAN